MAMLVGPLALASVGCTSILGDFTVAADTASDASDDGGQTNADAGDDSAATLDATQVDSGTSDGPNLLDVITIDSSMPDSSTPDSSAPDSSTPDSSTPDAACQDLMNDPKNCGTCGHDCTRLAHVTGAGVTCVAGVCHVPSSACASGFAHCSTNVDDGCEADLSQTNHCGTCTTVCSAPTGLCTASGGTHACTSSCTAPTPDLCSGTCTNLQSDTHNCRTCGTACSYANAAASCASATCSMGACNTGYKDCKNGPSDGCETYVSGADVNNCGDCFQQCSYANASAACHSGTCAMGACTFGYGDCKNGPADGCETLVNGSDTSNCGSCGHACLIAQSCSTGTCTNNAPNCVSGCDSNCTSPGRFAVDGNIVVDLQNGRKLWQRGYIANIKGEFATGYCQGLNLDGITGWRLPTSAELKDATSGIVLKPGGLQACATGYCCPSIDQAAFPGTPAAGFWTGDPITGGSMKDVDFSSGRVFADVSTDSQNARCVHDPI
jgi:hypothetical protein